jgi:GT2 family glycosyltransferase
MLYILIPVFNRIKFTRECLESLRLQSFTQFKTIVINDGSTDGTEAILGKEYPEVEIINGDGSLWWTASINLGIKKAMAEGATWIMTLNNDTLATPEFVEKMMYWAEKKPGALLGALAIDAKKNVPVYGGERIDWFWNKTSELLKVLPENEYHGLHQVTHFPGRGLLIPRAAIEKAGDFDEKQFPHYYADYEFTVRMNNAGFPVYCNYDAKLKVYPEESGDQQNRKQKSLKNYYNHLFGIKGGGNLRNFLKFSVRHCPKRYLLPYISIGIVKRMGGYLIK